MREQLLQAPEQMLIVWQRLTTQQRVVVALLSGGGLAMLLWLIIWARSPDYATAFVGLSQDDAAAVIGKLEELKIPYQIGDGEQVIKVPASQVHEARLRLASEGLPLGGGVGFELFNQTNFGMTEQTQRINYQRALEGELSRTINHLEPVRSSRVHLVLPQASLYTEREKQASASIFLDLKPGQELDSRQIQGIAHLVASSVDGLEAENLTILDERGRILSSPAGAYPLQSTSSQLELQRSYEASLERVVQAMLDQVVGPNRAVVKVSALFDWDQSQTEIESYTPVGKEGAVRSKRELVESSADLTSTPGGTPGSGSNIPSYPQVITGTNPYEYRREDTTTNYELTRRVRRMVKAPGVIKNLSVAVALDGDHISDQGQIDAISQLVGSAVGLDASQGDSITVVSVPFSKDHLEAQRQALDEARQWELYFSVAKVAAMVIGPLLLLLALRFLLRRGAAPSRALRPLRQEDYRVREMAPEPQLLEGDPQRRLIRRQVETLARSEPGTVSQLIRTWMEEDRTGP